MKPVTMFVLVFTASLAGMAAGYFILRGKVKADAKAVAGAGAGELIGEALKLFGAGS